MYALTSTWVITVYYLGPKKQGNGSHHIWWSLLGIPRHPILEWRRASALDRLQVPPPELNQMCSTPLTLNEFTLHGPPLGNTIPPTCLHYIGV